MGINADNVGCVLDAYIVSSSLCHHDQVRLFLSVDNNFSST